MKKTKPMHVDEATHKTIKKYAADKEITDREALARLVASGMKRLLAVRRYNKANR